MTRKRYPVPFVSKDTGYLLIWGVICVTLLNAGAGFWVLKKLEKKAGAPIHGRFIPHVFQPVFSFKGPQFSWEGRFEVFSGSLRVRYDPLSLFPGRKMRIHVWGEDLKVRLFDKLLESQPSEVVVNRAESELEIPRKGAPEIFFLEIDSPQIDFHIKR